MTAVLEGFAAVGTGVHLLESTLRLVEEIAQLRDRMKNGPRRVKALHEELGLLETMALRVRDNPRLQTPTVEIAIKSIELKVNDLNSLLAKDSGSSTAAFDRFISACKSRYTEARVLQSFGELERHKTSLILVVNELLPQIIDSSSDSRGKMGHSNQGYSPMPLQDSWSGDTHVDHMDIDDDSSQMDGFDASQAVVPFQHAQGAVTVPSNTTSSYPASGQQYSGGNDTSTSSTGPTATAQDCQYAPRVVFDRNTFTSSPNCGFGTLGGPDDSALDISDNTFTDSGDIFFGSIYAPSHSPRSGEDPAPSGCPPQRTSTQGQSSRRMEPPSGPPSGRRMKSNKFTNSNSIFIGHDADESGEYRRRLRRAHGSGPIARGSLRPWGQHDQGGSGQDQNDQGGSGQDQHDQGGSGKWMVQMRYPQPGPTSGS